jgi:sugar phosphate isomerase/epimerase
MLAALQVKHLYNLRNWVFGITPQTIRPMIPVRFDKNMAALTAIMELAQRHGVKLLVYVPPLRNDVAPPYDVLAYRSWQNSLGDICAAGAARFAVYGDLVPAQHWGHHGGEIDFMHFQDEGHRRLADAIVEGLEVNSRPR